MNRTKLLIAFVATLAIGAVLGIGITRWSAKSTAPMAAEGDRKILYWHDPMKPDVKFDKPGKSPFMDMELVPVYADEGQDAQVRVNPAASQNLGVRLGKVEKATMSTQLMAVGTVSFDEEMLEVVQSRVAGYVQRLHVKTNLQPVKRGQALADLVAPAWISAQEEYLSLLGAESARGRDIRDAARERLKVLGVPESEIQRLETTRKVNGATTIYAPIDGVITELGVREGSSITEGAPLFRVNSLRKVWAIAQVPETQMAAVSKDSKVTVTASGWPGERFDAHVLAVLPDLDAATRTLPVRVEIENRGERLVPGMFVSLEFATANAAPQLVIPSEAVIATGSRSVVVISRGDAGFDVREVKTGAESDGKTVILSGLDEGDQIVLSGQFLIDSEASLRSTVSRLSTAAGSEDAPAQEKSSHTAEGKIVAITPTSVTISHGPVPELQWGAMTMGFTLRDSAQTTGLAVGDSVTFEFQASADAGYEVVRLDKSHDHSEMNR
jgi:membrane fusion protein, copper/silver efflux system